MGKNLEEITSLEWRRRYQQQAGWTRSLRDFGYAASQIERAQRVLEVGCGPGVILEDLQGRTPAFIHGLDLDRAALELAAQTIPPAALLQADAGAIPYQTASFDHCLCHFLILWVIDPLAVVQEMKRVTRPGGYLLILAEPDYGGRIDYPPELAELGALQLSALRRQGANPLMGRQIRALLHQAGLDEIQAGVLGGQWADRPAPDDWQREWVVYRADLGDMITREQLDQYKQIDATAWDRGERILYVPTFYAWGKVP